MIPYFYINFHDETTHNSKNTNETKTFHSNIPFQTFHKAAKFIAEAEKALNRTTIFGFGKTQKFEGLIISLLPLYFLSIPLSPS